MSRLDEAITIITKMDDAIDKEITRVNKVRGARRMDLEKLENMSIYEANLIKIKSGLVIAAGMIESGNIRGARWHKARGVRRR